MPPLRSVIQVAALVSPMVTHLGLRLRVMAVPGLKTCILWVTNRLCRSPKVVKLVAAIPVRARPVILFDRLTTSIDFLGLIEQLLPGLFLPVISICALLGAKASTLGSVFMAIVPRKPLLALKNIIRFGLAPTVPLTVIVMTLPVIVMSPVVVLQVEGLTLNSPAGWSGLCILSILIEGAPVPIINSCWAVVLQIITLVVSVLKSLSWKELIGASRSGLLAMGLTMLLLWKVRPRTWSLRPCLALVILKGELVLKPVNRHLVRVLRLEKPVVKAVPFA